MATQYPDDSLLGLLLLLFTIRLLDLASLVRIFFSDVPNIPGHVSKNYGYTQSWLFSPIVKFFTRVAFYVHFVITLYDLVFAHPALSTFFVLVVEIAYWVIYRRTVVKTRQMSKNTNDHYYGRFTIFIWFLLMIVQIFHLGQFILFLF